MVMLQAEICMDQLGILDYRAFAIHANFILKLIMGLHF